MIGECDPNSGGFPLKIHMRMLSSGKVIRSRGDINKDLKKAAETFCSKLLLCLFKTTLYTKARGVCSKACLH